MTTAERDRTATRPPDEIPDRLAAVVDDLGLRPRFAELVEHGYTVLPGATDLAFTARLREACLSSGNRFMVIGDDPIYAEAAMNPSLLALAELSLGGGFLLSQIATSVRAKGPATLAMHADQNWLPAPFPEHNYLLTACWVCDDYTKEGGATLVVPGSHRLRRHPDERETAEQRDAIAIECPAGSITVWDGSVWHGNWPRTIDGERVVCHITYTRLAMRPVEDYRAVADDLVARHGPRMASLLGRDDFLDSPTGTDFRKVGSTFIAARS